EFYPAYGHPLEAHWKSTTGTTGWTSGFFPGVLWNLFAYNNSSDGLRRAMDVTAPTAPFANKTDTHDVGFVIMSGYGNAYRLLRRDEYLNIMVTAARSLITRYSSTVRCIRSWNSQEGFLVIIDNMMNLELLFEVANLTNDQTFYDIAWSHANRTMYEHIRTDNSSYHVVEYNETDGSVIRKYTAQGYADWSTWARGQSWAVYGFTVAYRYTKHQPFLDKAIGAANYFLARLPSDTDLVPYWDFDTPYNSTLVYQPRDTSAAAIFASGLLELSQYAPTLDVRDRFWTRAKAIVDQLSSPTYLISGNKDYKLPALLANGTQGPYPKAVYDVALPYGDYYLTQAVIRLAESVPSGGSREDHHLNLLKLCFFLIVSYNFC
ncbi:unnamed protein product, partial [Didymodactylos carnosus]